MVRARWRRQSLRPEAQKATRHTQAATRHTNARTFFALQPLGPGLQLFLHLWALALRPAGRVILLAQLLLQQLQPRLRVLVSKAGPGATASESGKAGAGGTRARGLVSEEQTTATYPPRRRRRRLGITADA